jgi:2-C-methyl-D-erythritol 4-phosphate cytidylyltransferase/2-C-methyl-D-erythritol 2,4-cyclodiphosphate synthase
MEALPVEASLNRYDSMKVVSEKIVSAVIVAAGIGVRAGGELPKQWQRVSGKTVAEWTISCFLNHPEVNEIIVVINPDDPNAVATLERFPNLITVDGADTRSGSVRAGLEACHDETDFVLIHDIARPCLSAELISELIASLSVNLAAAPGLAVTDALWRGHDGTVVGTEDRSGLFRAQTPQAFDFKTIVDAHKQFGEGAADDVEVVRKAGIDVAIVSGDEANIKITTPTDFARAAAILAERTRKIPVDIRVGNGFDVHRFGDGDQVVLCGINVPHNRGLQGHSDADVGLHTITDAIYGALAEGDIGTHFPPSDPQWRGAESYIFLEHARDLVISKGFVLTHVDCTLICETPKIGPHALTMRRKVSEILNIDLDRVSVKATTSERLGFTGRQEGIACMATATVVKMT